MTVETSTPDVVVVGSGAGGAAAAGAAARAGARVLVLEAGTAGDAGAHHRNADPSEHDLAAFGAEIVGAFTPHGWGAAAPQRAPGSGALHGLGGGLRLWTHHCPTPHPDEWPAVVPEADRAALLDTARALLRVEPTALRDGERQRRILAALRERFPDLPAGRGVQPLPVAGYRDGGHVRYTGAAELLAAPDGAVEVRSGWAVRRVLTDGDRVRGVEAVHRTSGAVLRAHAPAVVVAGGAIGSAQLLHASGLRLPALGTHLHDHAMTTTRIVLDGHLLDAVPADDAEFAVWVPSSPGHPRHLQVIRSPLAPGNRPTDDPAGRTADVVMFSPVVPRPENRLVLGAGPDDGLGLPAVSVVFDYAPADVDELAAAGAELLRVSTALADLNAGRETAVLPVGASFHLMGTTRLGADPADSVADPHGRVWGVEGLYVAGNGVLGAANSGNPTLMTIAIALRTAAAVTADAGTRTAAA
ncbi:GMC oxidoreductase [Pseudonocardia alni]|uniref:GMC oxidoreductase n=1 Tax=Pseudonocardia alni TaxID=33907 RepID=UPI0033F66639